MSNQQPASNAMTARTWAELLLLGAIWGGSSFFARIAVQDVQPLTLVFLRVAIAAAALHLYLLARGISFAPALRHAPRIAMLALFNNVIPFSLIFTGQKELGAGLASVLCATTPFWTIGLAARFGDETVSARKVAGVALGVAGTAALIGPGIVAGLGGPVWAKLALIGAALSYAVALLVARRIRGLPPSLVATGQLTASAAITVPVALFADRGTSMLAAGSASWAAILGLALLATAFAYILYFRIVVAAGATNASLVTLIVPASAILLGAVFLGERLDAAEIAGMALVAGGLLVIDGRLLSMAIRRRASGHDHGRPSQRKIS